MVCFTARDMAEVGQLMLNQDEVTEQDQDTGPLLETLVLLGVADDFVQAVGDSKLEEATEVAAQLKADLADLKDQAAPGSSAASTDPVAERRRELAAEARAEKASSDSVSCDFFIFGLLWILCANRAFFAGKDASTGNQYGLQKWHHTLQEVVRIEGSQRDPVRCKVRGVYSVPGQGRSFDCQPQPGFVVQEL